MDNDQKSLAAVYREHILNAKNFSGSAKEYCDKHNLNAQRFYAYKNEMGLSKKIQKKPAFAKVVTKSEPVVKLQPVKTLPEAKWLADFLYYYTNQR